MTGMTDPGFDPRIADWLEDDPDRAPDSTLAVVLAAFPSIPQGRASRAPWRLRPMNRMVLAGLAAVAAVLVASFTLLPPTSGPGAIPAASPSSSNAPSPSPSPTASSSPASPGASTFASKACRLLTTTEARNVLGVGGFGATQFESGSGTQSGCTFQNGPGDIILELTYVENGGAAAFATARARAGVQSVADVGAEAVYAPATATMYLTRGDALATIVAGTRGESAAARLGKATEVAKLVAPRL